MSAIAEWLYEITERLGLLFDNLSGAEYPNGILTGITILWLWIICSFILIVLLLIYISIQNKELEEVLSND